MANAIDEWQRFSNCPRVILSAAKNPGDAPSFQIFDQVLTIPDPGAEIPKSGFFSEFCTGFSSLLFVFCSPFPVLSVRIFSISYRPLGQPALGMFAFGAVGVCVHQDQPQDWRNSWQMTVPAP
jgi:hypothetical protein